MLAIFWRQLKKNSIMILGWGLGLALLGFYLFDIYETLFVANANVADFIGAFPEELMAFFGQQGGVIHTDQFSEHGILFLYAADPGDYGGFHGQRPGGPAGRGRHAGAGYRTAHQPVQGILG